MSIPSRTNGDGVKQFLLERPEGALSVACAHAVTPKSEYRAPVALLVPGFTGSKEDWFPVLADLAGRGITALAFSQRGQFHSDGPDGRGPVDASGYDLRTLGRDVHWLLDELKVTRDRKVHLLGHSFGGVVAIEAVLQNPLRFASLTLWNSGPRSRGPRAEQIAAVRSGGSEALWRWSNPGREPDSLDPAERWFYDRMLATHPSQLLGALQILQEQTDRIDELAAAKLPVLVSHGSEDDAWPQEWQRETAERLGAEYTVIPDAGHSAQADQPQLSAELLAAFWHAHPAEPGSLTR